MVTMEDTVKPPGQKFDDGKADIAMLLNYFPRALFAIALVSGYGLRKYQGSNAAGSGWQDVPDALHRYSAAGGRHDLLRRTEGEYDVMDSGLPHRAQKAWNALAELELAIMEGVVQANTGNEIDHSRDKPKPILGTAKPVNL